MTRWFEDIGRVYFIIYEDVSNDQCLKHFHTNDKHYDERRDDDDHRKDV